MEVIGVQSRTCLNGPTLFWVLVAGYNNDYACYVGFGPPDFVAKYGDKVTFEEAVIHFPEIEEGRYRR